MSDAGSNGVPDPDTRQPLLRHHTLPAGGVAALTVAAIAAAMWVIEIRVARKEAHLNLRLDTIEAKIDDGDDRFLLGYMAGARKRFRDD